MIHEAAELIAKVFGGSSLDDAVIDAIVLSSCADGVTDAEIDALAGAIEGTGAGDVNARVRASFERITAEGLDGRLRSLVDATIDDETKRRIFSAAVIIQYADGKVTNEENEFLLDLADVLGLNETRVRDIVAYIERELGMFVRSSPELPDVPDA